MTSRLRVINKAICFILSSENNVRGALGKFKVWRFVSVTELHGIILKCYISSMYGHKFHEDSIKQTRKTLL